MPRRDLYAKTIRKASMKDKRRLFLWVAVCALCVGGCRTIDARLEKADSPQTLAQAVADYYVHDAEDESCAVAIVSPTGTVFAQAGAATEHSLFRIASLSKFFLHPVLLKLHAQGRLNLDQPVTSCSKLDLPPEYGRITLRDLLLNRSGLPREFIVRWEPLDTWTAFSCGFFGQTDRLTRACAGHLPWLTRRGHDVPDHRLGGALRATGGLFSSAADCATLFSSYWPVVDEQLRERDINAYADEAVFGLLRVKVLSDGSRVLYRAGMIYGGASFVGFDLQTRTVVLILRNVTSWPSFLTIQSCQVFSKMSRLWPRGGADAPPAKPARFWQASRPGAAGRVLPVAASAATTCQ